MLSFTEAFLANLLDDTSWDALHALKYVAESHTAAPTHATPLTPHRSLLRLPLRFPWAPAMKGPRRGKQWRSALPQGREVQLYETMTSLQHSPLLWLFSWAPGTTGPRRGD
ncbi:hypothetical protein GWK47_011850 [Chionoecetes opilio]|uniref:Uncharacterized protein n=1 Tax=Chionoecetes opilio TaxID=41210 RepID=A0A8J4Y5Y4_CHIOP|nr:hypothetical protein GWK47_011850 [Chionoecetes opilio]